MSSLIAGLTLEQQIGQLFMVGFEGPTAPPEIIDLIQRYQIGGVIFFSRNIQNAQQVAALTGHLQELARAAGHPAPLLISVDQENGMVRRVCDGATAFPGNMALGAIGSEQMVADVAQATGDELKAVGINMNLAPVADVNNNPANPVIGARSFGEDPQQVARLTAAAVRGYRAAGVISTLKHFPGHGDTATDSHLALPVIPYGLERLETIELIPFKSGIAAGADAVMTAHIYLPALMSDELLPATVSPVILRGLLREELGFDGVIITDCLEMDAIAAGIGIEQGAVQALKAGADLVLISHRAARQCAGVEAALAAVRAGTLSTAEIAQAAERVLRLKQRFLSWDDALVATPRQVDRASHQQLADRAYEQSTTLARNEDALVPLHLEAGQPLLLVIPQTGAASQAAEWEEHDVFLLESIRQRHPNVRAVPVVPHPTDGDYEELAQAASAAQAILMVTMNANLDQRQVEVMQRLLQSGRPTIGVAAYNPYDLLAVPQLRTYLATYEYTRPALAAAVRVLFGETQPQGHLPVSLPISSAPNNHSS
jgi:beta-N-acetylhexosaminidase